MRKLLAALTGVFALLAIAFSTSRLFAEQDAIITVNPLETYQTMRGWEVTIRAWETNKKLDRFDPSWEAYREELAQLLANELGINRVRIEIKSGTENPVDYWALFRDGKIGYREYSRHYYEKINDNGDAYVANPAGFQFSVLDYQVEKFVLPLAKAVEANGEKLYVNLNYVDFGSPLKSTLSHAQNPEEYAELILFAFEHLKRRYGLTPNALEISLEPENTEHWRGRQIGEAMVAVAKRLKPAGFSPEMIAPSTTAARAAPSYFDEMISVPGAAKLLTEFSYHRYDTFANDALPEILKRARKLGVPTAMLEHVGGDTAELHTDLTVANASAWQQYGIATELSLKDKDRGAYYYVRDLATRDTPKLKMAERTRGLAQYFRYIRAGAVRIGATSSSGDVLPVAFRNPGGSAVVVAQAKSPATIRVTGLPAGVYGLRYTTSLETGRELPVARISSGEALAARIPAAGVITFYQKKDA